MSKSSSSSSSQATTQTINEDNRTVADGESIALGKNAALQINNDFGDNVAKAFDKLINFASDAGQAVLDATEKSIQANENALNKVASTAEREAKGANTIFTDLFPLIGIGMVGLVALTVLKK